MTDELGIAGGPTIEQRGEMMRRVDVFTRVLRIRPDVMIVTTPVVGGNKRWTRISGVDAGRLVVLIPGFNKNALVDRAVVKNFPPSLLVFLAAAAGQEITGGNDVLV